MNTVAIIQARMGSSRLPGKVLQLVAGKPVLWHVVHRLRQCREVNEVVIATTARDEDKPIVRFGETENVGVVCGPEDDVLARYLMAAKQFNADYIVRVTGDSPLVDPGFLDDMLSAMKPVGADICLVDSDGQKVIHEGFTPISRHALEALERFGGHDPAVREHVTYNVVEYVPDLKTAPMHANSRHYFDGARISVDTPADLDFMNTVYERLNVPPGEADIAEVVNLLRQHPELLAINAHVRQKKAEETSHTLLFRCDGGTQVGMGHVMRCLSLAQTLRDHFSVGVHFAMKDSTVPGDCAAIDLVRSYNFPCHIISPSTSEAETLFSILEQGRYRGVVFDIRTDLPPSTLTSIRNRGYLAVCIDDPSERRLASDLAFYPPVPQVNAMSWTRHVGTRHVGWEWVLVHPSFSAPPAARVTTSEPRILVSMGGADPQGMTLKALESLKKVHLDFEAHVVLGPAFRDDDAVASALQELHRPAHVHRNVRNIAELMAGMDMAVASFGVTAYELAACGVPALLLSLTEEHAIAAEAFTNARIARSLGLHQDVSVDMLSGHVESLLRDSTSRHDMSSAARTLDIRNGVMNVARKIQEALNQKSETA